MLVQKFGGTSVGTPQRILDVIHLVQESQLKDQDIWVVASAFTGVTNKLITVAKKGLARDPSAEEELAAIESRHLEAVRTLLPGSEQDVVAQWVQAQLQELRDLAHGIAHLRELTPRTLDAVMSFGEQLSCYIIAAAMNANRLPAQYIDARGMIKTDLTYGAARVNFDLTNWNIINRPVTPGVINVVTGFIASGKNDEATTLGRGGSDYTAAIIGAALDAQEIQIWTDVNGVLTADPSKVPTAFSLDSITYEEAMELSHFGAKVIHFPTMAPAMSKGIDIRILNTFNPSFPGTRITAQRVVSGRTVKGIASLDSVCLISVKGIGMMRATGIAGRIFSALAARGIDVILITQSSSEHSVLFAVRPESGPDARDAVEVEFRLELLAREIAGITVENDYTVIAVVGEETRNVPGIAGKVFQALGKNGVNIRAIAQGASVLNVTFAVRKADAAKSLNALHDNLFLSRFKTANLYVIGTGLVGSALIDLLNSQFAFARDTHHVRINVAGITNTRRMIFNPNGIDLSSWRASLDTQGEPANLTRFVERIAEMNLANAMVIDCTSSRAVVDQYLHLAGASVSIVCASKIANTLDMEFYNGLRAIVSKYNAQFRYSTNVGAALPILDSIKSIVNNGDNIVSIEGVLSGTLSAIFNDMQAGRSFSKAVFAARERGYTEPDPRVDLSGLDVARKLLILAREAGIALELGDIAVESLVPKELESVSPAEFIERLPELDAGMTRRIQQAASRQTRLMYVARFEHGKATVGVQALPQHHPFFGLSGNDNIVAVTTDSLYERPLILRGGGAGAERTASGLFTDILHVAHGMS